MSQIRWIKGGTADKAFRSIVFRGREELLLVWTLTFLTFKIFYMHKKIKKTLEEMRKQSRIGLV